MKRATDSSKLARMLSSPPAGSGLIWCNCCALPVWSTASPRNSFSPISKIFVNIAQIVGRHESGQSRFTKVADGVTKVDTFEQIKVGIGYELDLGWPTLGHPPGFT